MWGTWTLPNLLEYQHDCGISHIRHTGEHIYGPAPPSFNDPENMVGRVGPHVPFMQSHVNFHKCFLEQVAKLGLHVEWDKNVVDDFEDEETGQGSVVLAEGETCTADAAIAADGIKTDSAKIVAGRDKPTVESGLTIYRCSYPVEDALADPMVSQRWKMEKDSPPIWKFWQG